MRSKLFLAFLLIISLALISNIVFERLVIRDFNDFIRGTKEDHIYWLIASIEGAYQDGEWNFTMLGDALHWGLMLGFETYVENTSGEKVLASSDILSSMSPNMLDKMNSFFRLPSGVGEFTWYPLYVEGEEIGKLYIRPLERLGLIPLKEEIFRERGRRFLFISFLIAGGGALLLTILFTITLSNPVRRLTAAAEKIARGDYSVRGTRPRKRFKDEIDRLTDAFNYMAEALRREDALRRHLTSNIAHELRTPLTIVKGNLEALEDRVISDPDTAIKNIKSEIERLISLVEGIEDITLAEASFFKRGKPKEINLKEFVESVVSDMRKPIEDKGLFIRTDGPSISVQTYPEKLHIILKNLLTNAHKFTSKGGITITWGKHRHDNMTGFYISVEDTGQGIRKDEFSKVFERFYKGSGSDGMGLGLSIVKELTEVMGGRIEMESSPNKGTRFTVIF